MTDFISLIHILTRNLSQKSELIFELSFELVWQISSQNVVYIAQALSHRQTFVTF